MDLNELDANYDTLPKKLEGTHVEEPHRLHRENKSSDESSHNSNVPDKGLCFDNFSDEGMDRCTDSTAAFTVETPDGPDHPITADGFMALCNTMMQKD